MEIAAVLMDVSKISGKLLHGWEERKRPAYHHVVLKSIFQPESELQINRVSPVFTQFLRQILIKLL